MSDIETTKPAAGISNWIKKTAASGSLAEGQGTGKPLEIDIDLLDPNPEQPRIDMDADEMQELVDSVRQYGWIQAISVTRKPDGRYTVIAGHRRTEAARLLKASAANDAERTKWSKIPALDRGVTAVGELAELAITENTKRVDLRPIETAEAIAKLQTSKSLSAEQLAEKLSMELTKTKRYLQLASAPDAVREALGKGLMVEVDSEPTPSGKPRREHRRLEMNHALQVLRAHGHWSRAKPKKAAELTRALVDRVLSEGWPQRKLKDHVDALMEGRSQTAEAKGDSVGEEVSALSTSVKARAFQNDDNKLVVFRPRLAEASTEDRASLRALLSELLLQLN